MPIHSFAGGPWVRALLFAFGIIFAMALMTHISAAQAQAYGEADQSAPGDAMIQDYLKDVATEIGAVFPKDLASREDWERRRPQYREEYFHMLGLSPRPVRTPLKATMTGVYRGDGFVVEKLHFQSMPGLYVTANVYRPTTIPNGERLPAILYVCGHSPRGRNGNKTAYQSHGIWFARHGYVCLVLDTLQMGEIAAIHHGTYREGRWWWHSRGYTSAGVECWNGIRGIDYLIDRPDVDPERIGVTGISGGGAATFWIAAADERVAVAVPVSGMADLESYVTNRVINGHCDCMFLYNTFQWPWTRIASLIAPRPMLFVNSDADAIFPMDANERIINRLERVYSLYGASDRVDAFVSIGGHAYRQDIRQATFRFFNTWLKGDPSPVTDSEVDLVVGRRNQARHPIPPEALRVFTTDANIPANELNTTIDEHFVPMADQGAFPDGLQTFEKWREERLRRLSDLSFRWLSDPIPAARPIPRQSAGTEKLWLETERGIRIHGLALGTKPASREPIILWVGDDATKRIDFEVFGSPQEPPFKIFHITPRGHGETRWTRKDPPNYVERSHVLLGRTVDAGRILDILSTVQYLRHEYGQDTKITVAGRGASAVLALVAALLDPRIHAAALYGPPESLMDPDAPAILNVLRTADVPDLIGMLAPRAVALFDAPPALLDRARRYYDEAGAGGGMRVGHALIDLKQPSTVRRRAPILIAHRGGVVTPDIPECSQAAIVEAARRGYAMVELDIQQSRDGVPMVFHDRTLDNACGQTGAVSDWDAGQLGRMGYRNSRELILTLDEALAVCREWRLGVMLDLKTGRRDPEFLEKIGSLLSKHGLENATVSITGTDEARAAWDSVLFTPTRDQLDAVRQGAEPDLRHTFWFGLPPDLPSAEVARLKACGAYVFPAINTFRYPSEGHLQRARQDIARLQEAGVDGFQIDSVYDAFVQSPGVSP